ncbi:MAG: hypothetical protein M3044_11200, partial [Thermoproteota archaeon]|nr:hypothetical protein [Thermoproteota archaeon]
MHTTTKVIRKVVVVPRPSLSAADLKIVEFGRMDGKAGIYDLGAACAGLNGKGFDRCSFLYRTAYVLTCVHGPNGCGDGPTTLPPPPSSLCTEGGYSGPKIINPIFRCPPAGVV